MWLLKSEKGKSMLIGKLRKSNLYGEIVKSRFSSVMAMALGSGLEIDEAFGKEMTLLGAGGAATAIAVQAALDGVSTLHIFNRKGRSWERALKLADTINANTSCKAAVSDLADEASLRQALEASTILTNATSLGMAPHADTCPIPDASMLRPELIVSDIIYNPKQTRLLQMASANGCATFNGLYMLLFQGAEAFRLWTGKEMPIEPIREHYFMEYNTRR